MCEGKVIADPLESKLYAGKSCLSSYLEYPAPRVKSQQIFVEYLDIIPKLGGVENLMLFLMVS